MEPDSLLTASDNSENTEQTNNQNKEPNNLENSLPSLQEPENTARMSINNGGESSRCHFYGIMEFNIDTYKAPVFKEELTIEAMKKVGVTPEDLVKLSNNDIKMIPGNNETKAQIVNEIEKKRLNIINQVKIARKELINEQEKKKNFDQKYRIKKVEDVSTDQKDIEKYQRVQKREIERLIAVEFIEMEAKEAETYRQARLKEMMKEQEEKAKQKHEEEAKKRKIREDKVFNRLKEKEEELEKLKEKQLEEEKRRKEIEIQQANERKKEYQKQEQLKEIRLQKLKEEREKKEIENQKKIEEQIKEQKIKEELRLKQKQEEINSLREQHQKLLKKQMERAASAQKREKEELEAKYLKIQEDQRLTEKRMNEYRKKQQMELLTMKQRNNERILRSKQLAKKIEQDDLQKKETIQIKLVKAHERYVKLTADRQKKIEEARAENNEKVLKMIERKKKSEELFQKKVTSLNEKMKLKEEKFKSLKLKEEEELQNKAALTWLKQKFGEENAKRIQRKEEYEKEKALRNMEERNKVVDQLIYQSKIDRQRKFLLSFQAQQKRRELSEEFSKTVALRKSTADDEKSIYQLAKKYNVDMEEIKKKYSRKKAKTSFSDSFNNNDFESESFSIGNDSDYKINDSSDVTDDDNNDSTKNVPYMMNSPYSKDSQTGINFEAVSDCGYVFKYVPISQD